jgi:hypothetical protein
MKVFIVISLLILAGSKSQAQTNLVSNPSFEQTSSNNIYITTLNFTNWISPPDNLSSPDGFKNYSIGNCGGGCWPGQHTFAGDTYAYSGEKFVGVVAYYIQGGQQNSREYIHQELNAELITGHVYSIGFAVKFGSRTKYIIDSFGMYISDTSIGTTNTDPLNGNIIAVTPQLNLNMPIGDSSEWTVLSMDYTALGGEKYITLGNFTPDSLLNTSLNPLNHPSDINNYAKYSSYFFVDSVFIVDYDTTSANASVPELKSFLKYTLYPNPASDYVNVEIKEGVKVDEIILYDTQGRKVRNFAPEEREFNVVGISSGEYFLHLNTEFGTVVEKLRVE